MYRALVALDLGPGDGVVDVLLHLGHRRAGVGDELASVGHLLLVHPKLGPIALHDTYDSE
jgi:hypothetical protein